MIASDLWGAMSKEQAFQASARFGLGARPGELDLIASDVRGWLLKQLKAPVIPQVLLDGVGQGDRLVRPSKPSGPEGEKATPKDMQGRRRPYIEQTAARFMAQVESSQPLVERMVLFWSNHFTVSVQKGIITPVVNDYEIQAIRPHVGGYFKDMLLAVARHPAMLLYLDNARSFGENSIISSRRKLGLNENLAREILELHTLGVDGGYVQADVLALAKILTGWTLAQSKEGAVFSYAYRPAVHELGDKTLLGMLFRQEGEQEGIKALTMLGEHPATARHVATKLVRHFIDDDPPAQCVAAVAKSFTDSKGHLPTVVATVIAQKEAWVPLKKFKTTYEFVVSAYRACGVKARSLEVLKTLDSLDFRPFGATSPAGFDDVAASWMSPNGMSKRIEWAYRFAQQLPASVDPMEVAVRTVGPVLSETTRQTIERAASGKDGVALLLVSPEFQRR